MSLGGGPEHRLGTLVGLAVALEKGYEVEDNTAWRGGRAIPDGVIYKPSEKRRGVPTTYWLETVCTHDPRREWRIAGYSVTDVLTADISECKTVDEVYRTWMRVIP